MNDPTNWTTPTDVNRQLHSYWSRGRMLAARLDGAAMFPLELRLRKPDMRALAERFDEVRNWIRALEDGSKSRQGFGYEIEWTEINHRQLGRNRLPARIRVATEFDALRLIGKTDQAEQFQSLADATLKYFPGLRDWLTRRPLTALKHLDDWERILTTLAWFQNHPRAGLYLRQLDISGVDTKFIESRKGLLSDLLDWVLPVEAIDMRFTGSKSFEHRYGLACKPPLVRFRLLDDRLNIRGLCDITVPAAQFARLAAPVKRVFITENEVNGLAFPEASESLVVFGLGYGLDRLAEVEWLKTKMLYYWGDIDTHGFAILDRFRASFSHARSFLMDRETLVEHSDLWIRENEPYRGALSRLTVSERALFDELRYNHLGEQVRLEQERISFGCLKRALETLTTACG